MTVNKERAGEDVQTFVGGFSYKDADEGESRTKSRRLSGTGSTTNARGAGVYEGFTLALFCEVGGTIDVLYILKCPLKPHGCAILP